MASLPTRRKWLLIGLALGLALAAPAQGRNKRKQPDSARANEGEPSAKRQKLKTDTRRVRFVASPDRVLQGRQVYFRAKVVWGSRAIWAWDVDLAWSIREGGSGTVDPDTGLYTAPSEMKGEESCTVRAALAADATVYQDHTFRIVPAGGKTSGREVLKEATGDELNQMAVTNLFGDAYQDAWTTGGLPFLNPATGQRWSQPTTRMEVKEMGEAYSLTCGYGLPVKAPCPSAQAQLLSCRYQGPNDWVHFPDPDPVRLNGWVYQASLEILSQDSITGDWLSIIQPASIEVRGVMPFAGNAAFSLPEGQDGEDGLGGAARFRKPGGLAFLGKGEKAVLVVADEEANTLRLVTMAGQVTTLAAAQKESKEGLKATAAITFNRPTFLLPWNSQAVMVADSGNHQIRYVGLDGTHYVIAGTGQAGFKDGPKGTSQFDTPMGMAQDDSGNIYVADHGNHRIRKIDMLRNVTTVAGTGEKGSHDGNGSEATFSDLKGLALAWGRLWAVDGTSIRCIALTEGFPVRTVATSGQPLRPHTTELAELGDPYAIESCTTFTRGWLGFLITDRSNHAVREMVLVKANSMVEGNHASVYEISLLAGGDASTGFRPGLLRDGALGAFEGRIASLAAPLGIAPNEDGQAFLACGNSVVRLSDCGLYGSLVRSAARPRARLAVTLQGDSTVESSRAQDDLTLPAGTHRVVINHDHSSFFSGLLMGELWLVDQGRREKRMWSGEAEMGQEDAWSPQVAMREPGTYHLLLTSFDQDGLGHTDPPRSIHVVEAKTR